jgi:sodium transport system permease protein
MSFRYSLSVARKELVTSLRDRQTALYTFVLPLVMYPGVFWLMVQGFLVVQGQRERTDVTVGLAVEQPAELYAELAEDLDSRPDPEADSNAALAPHANVVRVEQRPQAGSEAGARAWVSTEVDQPPEDEPRHPDAVLWVADPDGESPGARLFYDSARSRSELARKRVEARLPAFASRLRGKAAQKLGINPDELDPVSVIPESVAPPRDVGALILSTLLPIMLVVMAVMGAFFPAIDLTAGEKERKTAETTLLLPVPRSAMLQGKILAVCCTACVATTLNLLAIGLSAEHLVSMLNSQSGGRGIGFDLPVLALLAIAPLAVLFSFFISAVLTGIGGLAATFKEGQAMLGPVQLVFILPAMIGAVPGMKLSLGWACVPVVNVVLAFRAMLRGEPLYLEYAVCALALLLYAWISIRAAVFILSREEVLLAGATIPLKRLVRALRSGGRAR